MELTNVNPFIRYARLHKEHKYKNEPSVCYDCRLFYVLSGDGEFVINGKNYPVSQGFCAYLPPKSHYFFNFNSENPIKIYVLNFDLIDAFSYKTKSLNTATERTFKEEKVLRYELPSEFSEPIIQSNAVYIETHVANCVQLFLEQVAYFKHLSSAHLKFALVSLLSEARGEKSDYRLIQSVQEYVRNNYQNPELTNFEIAQKFNYHPYHVSRLMKAHTSKTLRDYIIDYRLRMAKNYLITTSLSVTEIAEKTGFASYTYFIKIFRERTGVSPLKYKNQNKDNGI